MPEDEISRRGGAVSWRTVRLPDGRWARIAIVSEAGPRGGHTVIGKIHDRKG